MVKDAAGDHDIKRSFTKGWPKQIHLQETDVGKAAAILKRFGVV
jgi:hypothetical protein